MGKGLGVWRYGVASDWSRTETGCGSTGTKRSAWEGGLYSFGVFLFCSREKEQGGGVGGGQFS